MNSYSWIQVNFLSSLPLSAKSGVLIQKVCYSVLTEMDVDKAE